MRIFTDWIDVLAMGVLIAILAAAVGAWRVRSADTTETPCAPPGEVTHACTVIPIGFAEFLVCQSLYNREETIVIRRPEVDKI